MAKVLITGLDSFTGSHLGRWLSDSGHQVFGTSLKSGDGKRLLQCDIAEADDCERVVRQVKPDYVVHLAGISFVGHEHLDAFYKVNTVGTEYLLQALAQHAPDVKKVVLAGSATVYGNRGLPVLDESLAPQPANHYGMSKLAMEFAAANFYGKLPIIITRPFNYTGVGQPEHFLIPKIVTHFKRGEKTIELGNLHVAREFNDIRFACDVYARLLECSSDGLITNLCSGHAVRLLDIVAMMNEIAGYEIEVKVNPAFVRANDIPSLVGSPERLENTIGRLKTFSIRDTLLEMYRN